MAGTATAQILPPGLRALVVEDSRATRRIFRSLLAGLDMQVEEAGDGVDALAFLEGHPGETDVIYADISMPRMDGFDLCYRLQQAPWYDGTPLVMVSTQSDAAVVIRALKLGADDYLPKPFNRSDLVRITQRVLRHG